VSPDGTTLAVLTTSGISLVTTLPHILATFSYPMDEQANVDLTRPISWNPGAGAQGYYVSVGTAPYGSDLVNSGVLPPTQLTFKLPKLSVRNTLYATLFTKTNGTWTRFVAVTFVGTYAATFTYPLAGQADVDTTRPFTWNSIAAAQGYYLVVGTTQNGSDLVNSGVLAPTQSSFNTPDLPVGKNIWAVLLTKLNGTWTEAETIEFTAAAGHATFINPVNGQTTVDNAQPFTWTKLFGAQGYILVVGTTKYGTDLVNSGVLAASQSSYTVPTLPKGKILYATLLTKVNGTFSRYQLVAFVVG
jgi:hypothetical protein